MALNLANVELSDSFNAWRLKTNSIIARSMQATGTALSTANTQFNARVTTNNVLNVNNNIVVLRNVSLNGPGNLNVRSKLTHSNTSHFNSTVHFSGQVYTNSVLNVNNNVTFTGGRSVNGPGSLTWRVGTTFANSITFSASAPVSFTANATFNGGVVTNYLRSSGDIQADDLIGNTLAATTISGTTITGTNINGTTITATDFNSTSDKRFKDNISPIIDPLSTISKLEGVHFNWKETGKPSIGLIAQDVEQVLPEIVSTDDNGVKYINYGLLTALLLEAIKQQQTVINKLTNS